MPYTPPALRSPASSAPPSPEVSRRSSFQGTSPTTSRPSLPKSTSYLTKHRRTPSAPGALSTHHAWHPTPEATSEDLKHMVVVSPSVRQSPPPVTDSNAMPKGAMISPPDSSSDPEDDEGTQPEIRGRRIGNLKELQDAISQIPQHRESSPEKAECAIDDSTPVVEHTARVSIDADPGDLLISTGPRPKGLPEGFHHSFSTGTLDQLVAQQRRISHARSLTEPSFELTKSPGTSLAGSDEESDEEVMRKPQMVRKKSGELVRPALRPPSRRRPSSMPGTPTFSNKAVHFDSHLEHVRHFLQVDRPLAVSAGSSPIDNYESDNEYPWDNKVSVPRTPPHEWEIIVCNFPTQTPARKNLLVRLERVWVSPDQKSLVGTVAVANVAFQKSVVCRFTLDYWKTVSEVAAEYICEIVPRETQFTHDRFQFTIKLSDLANLESKTLYFCVRYNVNGQELWDNNDGTNFQADFRKKMLPQNGKKGTIGAASRPVNSLPRSNRRANPSTAPRPKSMPAGSLDDFNASNKVNFEQSIHDYLGESESTSLRLKAKPPTNLASDNLAGRLSAPSGQAFANRYDFGASLTAAVQAAKDAMAPRPDGLQIQSLPRRVAGPSVRLSTGNSAEASTSASESRPVAAASRLAAAPKRLEAPKGKPAVPVVTRPVPLAPAVPGSPSAAIASSSYEELVNKYCFFNSSKQSSPPLKDGTLRDGRFDGPDEILASQSPASVSSSNTGSTSSSGNGSPVQMGQFVSRGRQPLSQSKPFAFGEPQHLTSQIKDTNPYFQHAAALMSSLGPSPAESPLMGLAVQRTGSPHQARSSPVSSQVGVSPSATPVAAARSYGPYGASPPGDFSHMHDRFPFFGADAHAATAIRG